MGITDLAISTDAIIGIVISVLLLCFLIVNSIYWYQIVSEFNNKALVETALTISKSTAQTFMIISIIGAIIVVLYMLYNTARWFYSVNLDTQKQYVAGKWQAAKIAAAEKKKYLGEKIEAAKTSIGETIEEKKLYLANKWQSYRAKKPLSDQMPGFPGMNPGPQVNVPEPDVKKIVNQNTNPFQQPNPNVQVNKEPMLPPSSPVSSPAYVNQLIKAGPQVEDPEPSETFMGIPFQQPGPNVTRIGDGPISLNKKYTPKYDPKNGAVVCGEKDPNEPKQNISKIAKEGNDYILTGTVPFKNNWNKRVRFDIKTDEAPESFDSKQPSGTKDNQPIVIDT